MSRRSGSTEFQQDLFAVEGTISVHPDLVIPAEFDAQRAKDLGKQRNKRLDSSQKKKTAGFRSATEQLWIPYSGREMKTAAQGPENAIRNTYLSTLDRIINQQDCSIKTAREAAAVASMKLLGPIRSGWQQDALRRKSEIEAIIDPQTGALGNDVNQALQDYNTIEEFYESEPAPHPQIPISPQQLALDGMLLYMVMFRSFSGEYSTKSGSSKWFNTAPIESKENKRVSQMRHHKAIKREKSQIFAELRHADEDSVDNLVVEALFSNWSRFRYWRQAHERIATKQKAVNKMDPHDFEEPVPDEIRFAFIED